MVVDITKLTNGSVDYSNPDNPVWTGTGVLDKLLNVFNSNIAMQVDARRLTGSDLAQVYVTGLQACLNSAITLTLEAEMLEKKLSLLDVQIASEEKKLSLLDAQIDDVIKGIELKDVQKAEINKSTELKEEQRKLSYTQRVKEDKSTAMLGLDGVMKKQNQIVDSNHIYTPKYVSA